MRTVKANEQRTRRDREVLRAEDFSEDDLERIAASKVPEEFASLDEELGVCGFLL
ncbi:MAG: hypothetical protein KBA31_16360 [Alphaproteobacteria bacterium]|nr:hypothetical protein [Alphaproteobacteria bacterium]